MAVSLADETANAIVDAIAALFDNGWKDVYTSAKPTNADTALGAQTLLASLRYGDPAWDPAVAGEADSNALTPDASADANGTAAFVRAYRENHTTVIMDGTAGTSDADFIFSTLDFVAGAVVTE